jgi:chromosomal replication initiator protein
MIKPIPLSPFLEYRRILKVVCAMFKIKPKELPKGQAWRVVWPRYLCIYLLRTRTSYTIREIGDFFNRDHTSVIASLKAFHNQLDTNPKSRRELSALEQSLGAGNRSKS